MTCSDCFQKYFHNIVPTRKKQPLREIVLIVVKIFLIFFWVVWQNCNIKNAMDFYWIQLHVLFFVFYFRQTALKLALSMLLPTPRLQAVREDSRPGEAAVESVFTVALPTWGYSLLLSPSPTQLWHGTIWNGFMSQKTLLFQILV